MQEMVQMMLEDLEMQTLELQLWVQLTSAKLLKNNRKRKKRK